MPHTHLLELLAHGRGFSGIRLSGRRHSAPASLGALLITCGWAGLIAYRADWLNREAWNCTPAGDRRFVLACAAMVAAGVLLLVGDCLL